MKKTPQFLKKYFWDIDFSKLDPEKSPEYIIERLLEVGDDKAIRWLMQTFNTNIIKNVILHRRGISPKTAYFWSALLNIDVKDIVCLQTPYLKTRQTHWPY